MIWSTEDHYFPDRRPDFYDLPEECLVKALSFLNARDVCTFQLCCRRSRDLGREPFAWSRRLKDSFGLRVRVALLFNPSISWPLCVILCDYSASLDPYIRLGQERSKKSTASIFLSITAALKQHYLKSPASCFFL